MEIAIAIGLGLWFVVTSGISCLAVFKSFKNVKSEEIEE